jgi:hypothetical protein
MKTTQQMWEDKLWPIRNGLYFADGTVVLLSILMPWETANKAVSIKISKTVTLEEVEEFGKNETTRIGSNNEQSYPDLNLRVLSGEASHGSEGFVAVTQITTGHLVWLAYFDCSNPFEKVSLVNGIVTAISNLGHAWHLPLAEPATLTVVVNEQ